MFVDEEVSSTFEMKRNCLKWNKIGKNEMMMIMKLVFRVIE